MKTDEFLTSGASLQRLLNEYEKHGSLFIGYDFDGTVHDFHKEGIKYPKLEWLLRELKSIGCQCVCWTAYKDLSYVREYLRVNNIPCDGINTDGVKLPWTTRKPFYSATLDDRAGLIQVYEELTELVKIVKEKQHASFEHDGLL